MCLWEFYFWVRRETKALVERNACKDHRPLRVVFLAQPKMVKSIIKEGEGIGYMVFSNCTVPVYPTNFLRVLRSILTGEHHTPTTPPCCKRKAVPGWYNTPYLRLTNRGGHRKSYCPAAGTRMVRIYSEGEGERTLLLLLVMNSSKKTSIWYDSYTSR